MIKLLTKISDEEKFICQKYVDLGLDVKATSKCVGKDAKSLERIINKTQCQTYINWRSIEADRKDRLEYNYKIYKIKRVIDDFIPDDHSLPLDSKQVAVALSAISESNKMQGHYSVEKIITANVNMDADIEHAKNIMRDLLVQYKRDY